MSKREQERKLRQILDRMTVETRPFRDNSARARKRRVARARGDYGYFCRTYLPHYFDTELSAFHQELASLMEIRGSLVACAAPRGHGKSTIATLAKPVREIVFEARHFIVVVSSTEDLAKLQTTAIKLELEENQRLRADFGDLTDRQGSWAKGLFITPNGVLVLARGRGQGVRGVKHGPHRPDLVIFDDAESDKQAQSPDQVRELLGYVRKSIIPAMRRDRAWSFFWVDTIKARRSALDTVLEDSSGEYSSWIKRKYQAVLSNGSPLCPEMFTAEDLAKVKVDIGSVAFNQEYQNEPIDEEGLFREAWLTTYHPGLVDHELARGVTCAFIDPAVGASKLSDYCAIVVVTRHPKSAELYVREAWIRKASIDAMVAAAYTIHERYSCQRMGLESVAFSEVLFRDFNAAAIFRGYHLPLAKVGQHIKKEVRVASLSPLHERGLVKYPEGYPGDIRLLKEQLLSFPSRSIKDDGPDALEGAIRLCEQAVSGGLKDLEVVGGRRFDEDAYRERNGIWEKDERGYW